MSESIENINDDNHIWDTLKCAFQKILQNNDSCSNYSITELYRYSYRMITNKLCEHLFNGLKEIIVEYLENNARVIILNASSDNFLHVFCNIWEHFQIAMDSISRILTYLDRMFKENKSNNQVNLMSMELFCDLILYYNNNFDTIQTILLRMMNDEMDGNIVDREDIKRVLTMFMSIESNSNGVNEENTSIFDVRLKQTILIQFSTFINEKGEKLIKTAANAFAYIDAAKSIIARENSRIDYYFNGNTQNEFMSIMYDKLVRQHMYTIVEMEDINLTYMFQNNKYEDLSRIFSFLNHIPCGYKPINHYLNLYIRELGKIIVRDKSSDDFIQSLIDLNSKCDNFANCLENNTQYLAECKESFIYIMKLNPNAIKCFTKYIVDQLNAHLHSGESVSHIETIIAKPLKIATYIEKRNFLEDSCRQFIAKMILNKVFENSDLNDTELILMSILKPFCSQKFIRNVNNMLTDVKANKTLMEQFKQHTDQSNERHLNSMDDLTVGLLSKTDWPSYVRTKCNIPLELTNAYENFLKFYKKNHARRLTFLPNLGIAYLKAVFYGSPQSDEKSLASVSPKEYTIQASTFQTFVLLLFNNNDKLTLKTILKETDIPEKRLIQILQSLTCERPSQSSVLLKNPPGEKFEHTDEFCINEEFSSESDKVSILSEETNLKKLFNKTVSEDVAVSDREIEIKSIIVSIMKSAKAMTHIRLINEVEKANSIFALYQSYLTVVQKQIDSLIEEKCLAISVHGNNNTYVYIA